MSKEILSIALMILINTILITGVGFTIVDIEDSHIPKDVKCYDRYGSEIVGEKCLTKVNLFPFDIILIMLVLFEAFAITALLIIAMFIIVKKIDKRRKMKDLSPGGKK